MAREVILASQSPQRRSVMATLGIPFKTVPADLDELAIQDKDLVKRAEILARTKAEVIAAQFPEAIIVAGDTYVIHQGVALEKPTSLDEARQMLRQQSGQALMAVTGVCYIDPQVGINDSKSEVNHFTFRTLSDEEIEKFVSSQPVTTWSAAFCPTYIESAAMIAKAEGSFTAFTNGLPMEFVVERLRQSGVLA